MIKLLSAALAAVVLASTAAHADPASVIPNEASVGTASGTLTKLHSNGQAIEATIADATNPQAPYIGICEGNCGTTGNATIGIGGQVGCQFDGSTVAGNYAIASITSNGKCHDSGIASNSGSYPSQLTIGTIRATRTGAGIANVMLSIGQVPGATAAGGSLWMSFASFLSRNVYAESFGFKASNTAAANMTALQAAFAYACSTIGPAAAVQLPQGQFAVTPAAPVTVNCTGVSLAGSGNQPTALLEPPGVAGNLFKWTQPPGLAAGGYASISNLRIFQSGNPSSGSCILLDHVTSMKLKDVAIDGCFEDVTVVASGDIVIDTLISTGVNTNAASTNVHYYRNVVALTTSASTASGLVLPFASTAGVYVGQAVTGTNIPANTSVASFTGVAVTLSQAISGTVGSGATITFTDPNPANNFLVNSDLWPSAIGGVGNNVVVGDSDGLALNNNHMGRAIGDDLLIKPSTVTSRIVGVGCAGGQRPTFDSPGGYGVHFAALGGYSGTNGVHHFVGCGVNAAGSDGYRFDDPAVFNVTVAALGLQNNAGNGVNIQAGHDLSFPGGDAYNNNTGNSSASDFLVGGTARNVYIGGFAFNASGATHAVPYHITVADSAEYVTVGSNVYRGAASGRDINNTSTADPSHFYFAPGSTDQATLAWTAGAANPNILINGAMEFDQVNEGASVSIPNSGTNTYIVDGWLASAISAASGLTGQRTADAPNGYPNSIIFTVGTASATVGATDFFEVRQKLEGNQITNMAFGTASAQVVTVCFWAKSSVAATFTATLANLPATRSFPVSNTLAATGTWQHFCNTIPGDVAGSWTLTGTSAQAQVRFAIESGSSLQGTARTWQTGNFDGVAGQTQLTTTNGATFELTGIKLEIASLPTPFVRDYAVELRRAQRYYEKSYDIGTALGTATGQGSGGLYAYGGGNGNNGGGTIFFKTPKSCHPTMTGYSPQTGTINKARDYSANADVTPTFLAASNESALMFATTASGAISLEAHWTADCRL